MGYNVKTVEKGIFREQNKPRYGRCVVRNYPMERKRVSWWKG